MTLINAHPTIHQREIIINITILFQHCAFTVDYIQMD